MGSPGHQQKTLSTRLLRIGLRTVVLAFVGYFAVHTISIYLEMTDGGGRLLRRQVKEIRAGKTDSLSLHSTRGTDTLLEQIRGMPEIEHVYLDSTDITPVGMRHIGTLPNLKSIMAYDGVGGDEGLLALRNCKKLKSVAIFDGTITAEAIAELEREIPNARIGTKHEDNSAQPLSQRDTDGHPAPTQDEKSETN